MVGLRWILVAVAFLLVGSVSGTAFHKQSLLSVPPKKLQTRLNFLNGLRSKLIAMRDNPLLKSENTALGSVLGKINRVLKMAGCKSTKKTNLDCGPKPSAPLAKIELAVKDVQKNINGLKQDLVRKAFEINKELQSNLKKAKNRIASKGSLGAEAAASREDLFEQLIEVQDAPIAEQTKVVERFISRADKISNNDLLMESVSSFGGNRKYNNEASSNTRGDRDHLHLLDHIEDPFVAKFYKRIKQGRYPEGSNLAMQFGLLVDNQEADSATKEQDLARLTHTAHLSKKQAQTLLPILQKVTAQKLDKDERLEKIDHKLQSLQVTERFYKKHKAVLSREAAMLDQARSAIEHGEVEKLSGAMEQLKSLAFSL